jgi:hypothetical protein
MFLLLAFAYFFSANEAQSQEFLTISPLLKKHGLELVPVEKREKKQFLFFAGSEFEGEKALLSANSSLVELVKVDSKKRPLKSESCGSEILSYLFEAKTEADAIFAVIGKKIPIDLQLRWIPLKEIAFEKPEHPKIKKGFIVSQFQTAESADKEIFYFLEADSKQKRKFMALEKKWGEKVYEKFSPDCSNPEYSIQSIGKISNQGKNTTYLQHPVDCDGMGYKKGSFDKPLGILEIVENKQKEKWVIYRAEGYEGEAFLAVEYEPKKGNNRKVDFYIYSGC